MEATGAFAAMALVASGLGIAMKVPWTALTRPLWATWHQIIAAVGGEV
jgi:hypothetical protein